jgi:2-octaprenyl-6-methoxyphenol hydroxylase
MPRTPANSTQQFDIAIVGPGSVGTTAALALARAGYTVALIGPAAARRDGRTVALLERSWGLLDELGVTAALASEAAPLAKMRLVDDTGSLFRRPPTEFRASEIGLEQFGWNVETVTLNEALLRAVDGDEAITRFDGAVTDVSASAGAVLVTLTDGARIGARLVVGADGRRSAVRAATGVATREWSYPQTALTTIVRHDRDHRDVSTEFHTRHGPCTTVPLPGRRSSIVWMMAPEEAERHAAMDDKALGLAIEKRTRSILGRMTIDGPRGATPMGGLSVERFTAPRVALVGEAAHVFPPIGAQGLNLGMRDVQSLLDSISRDDPGAAGGLAAYEASRQGDVRTRTGAVDALNRSLLADFLPVDFARGFGLLALDTIAPLRRMVMRQGLNPGRG